MKKILFIHPDLRGGGAEKVLVNMLNGLDKSKYSISLATIFEEGVNKEILSDTVHHRFLLKNVFKGWSLVQKIFSTTFLYKKITKNEEFDLIVAYLEGVPTRIMSGCNNPNTKLISWIHVDLKEFPIKKVYRNTKEMEQSYSKCDAIIGVSKTALNSISSKVSGLPKEKLHVIHNVVDTDLILNNGNQSLNDVDFSKKVVNLCTVGRLAQQKGYKRLLKVISKLAKEDLKFHLYIIGVGEQESELKQIIEEEKINNYVSLLGFKKNPHKYVKNSDLFVCSSYQEGFSTAVTESVLLGTPVITTNCAGMDEILDNGKYGKIVDNDEQSLYEGLKELLNNKELIDNYTELTNKRSLELQNRDNIKEIENLFDKILK